MFLHKRRVRLGRRSKRASQEFCCVDGRMHVLILLDASSTLLDCRRRSQNFAALACPSRRGNGHARATYSNFIRRQDTYSSLLRKYCNPKVNVGSFCAWFSDVNRVCKRVVTLPQFCRLEHPSPLLPVAKNAGNSVDTSCMEQKGSLDCGALFFDAREPDAVLIGVKRKRQSSFNGRAHTQIPTLHCSK